MVDVDGGGARQLVDHALARDPPDYVGEHSVEHPTWSPDGRSIAFSLFFGYGFSTPSQIFIVNADGADGRHLVDGWRPTWSPNGPLLAFEGAAASRSSALTDRAGTLPFPGLSCRLRAGHRTAAFSSSATAACSCGKGAQNGS